MILLGTAVNAATVLAGGSIGCLVRTRLPERLSTAAFRGIGLFTLVIGFAMALRTASLLVLAASCIVGSLAGEALDLDARIRRLGDWLKARTRSGSSRFGEGMTAAFLLFCMGSMTLIGAIEEGMGGSSELLLAKAVMDGFAALLLASALGVGVVFSIVPLVLYQGGLTLLAALSGSALPEAVITEMSAAGGVVLVGLGIEILGIRRLTVANMLPALVVSALLAAVLPGAGLF